MDGSINKTDKSTFMKHSEYRIDTVGPVEVNVILIRSQVNLPSTYGGLASAILSRIIGLALRVDLICDTYSDRPSIKDMEHTAQSSDAETLFSLWSQTKEAKGIAGSSEFISFQESTLAIFSRCMPKTNLL